MPNALRIVSEGILSSLCATAPNKIAVATATATATATARAKIE